MIDLNQLKAFKKEASGAGYESEGPKNEVKEVEKDREAIYKKVEECLRE